MNMMKKTLFACCITLCFFSAQAMDYTYSGLMPIKNNLLIKADSSIPRVFVLGQYDGSPFERLKKDYETSLVTACKNDMETAYYCWMHLLKHMESFGAKSNFDLNGIKMWLYVFWEKDGTIGYISYYPKPNSKNFKAEDMTAFLNDFCKNYTIPLKYEKPFSNYSTASFPVMVEKINNNSNNGNGSGSVNNSKTAKSSKGQD